MRKCAVFEPSRGPNKTIPKERRNANLNTATFDRQGMLWFTGQSGIYGRLDTGTGAIAVFDAPRGTGPYGIATTPDGQVFFASLAGNYLGQIDLETGSVTVLEPSVPRQGARRVWSDSRGAIWIAGWNSGDLCLMSPSIASCAAAISYGSPSTTSVSEGMCAIGPP